MKYIRGTELNWIMPIRENEKIIKSKTKEFLGIGSVVTASTYLDYVIDFVLVSRRSSGSRRVGSGGVV